MDVRTPAARSTDPETSHLAAEQITASGNRAHHQNLTVTAVHLHPGKTSLELAAESGVDRYQLARRLPECENGGAVHRGEARTCSVSGRLALTWWPGPKPSEAQA